MITAVEKSTAKSASKGKEEKQTEPVSLAKMVDLSLPAITDIMFFPSGVGIPNCELVMLVGFPGSGKSTVYRKFFANRGYAHVNQDRLKTKKKCVTECKTLLSEGKSVVIDNTNPSDDTRKEYLNLCRQFAIPARCIHLSIPRSLAFQNNIYRHLTSVAKYGEAESVKKVPMLAYFIYEKRFVPPTKEEGFCSVVSVEILKHRPLDLPEPSLEQSKNPNGFSEKAGEEYLDYLRRVDLSVMKKKKKEAKKRLVKEVDSTDIWEKKRKL
eukprot:Nk52_evm2s859 gene=Nk52_evmTU2s859